MDKPRKNRTSLRTELEPPTSLNVGKSSGHSPTKSRTAFSSHSSDGYCESDILTIENIEESYASVQLYSVEFTRSEGENASTVLAPDRNRIKSQKKRDKKGNESKYEACECNTCVIQ